MTIPDGPIHVGVFNSPRPGGAVPAPGELQIKERRSWKTWQLIAAMVVMLVIGMAISSTYNGGSANASSTNSQESLPPPAGSSVSTTTPTTTPISGGGGGASTTTTVVASTTSSSTATSPTVVPTPARVLLGPTQSQGNWDSPDFTITNPSWNIGWAFQCTPAPNSGPAFEIYVVPAGGTATGTPAVNETGAAGSSVTAQSSVGQQMLVVQAPANCEWVVKVTGS